LKSSRKLCRGQSLAPKIELISAERIRDELIKLFAASLGSALFRRRTPHGRAGLVLLLDSGLLPGVLPELIGHDCVRAIAGFSSRRQRVRAHPADAGKNAAGRASQVIAVGGDFA
jgi:hypothetical protein